MDTNAISFSLLNHFPALKRVLRSVRSRLFSGTSCSSNYVTLGCEDADTEARRLCDSWRDDALPQRQRELVDQQLRKYRAGISVDVFDTFASSVRALPDLASGMSLLEIGCSSGYYSEVAEISNLPIKYSGCDYSEAFIRLAKKTYPSIDFAVEDATALRYPDRSFDIVVSGGCLLHIPNYTRAIEETSRVVNRYAIFHRTPVVWGQAEQWYRKQAYGVETLEIRFNEAEFLALLAKNGLELIMTYTLHEGGTGDKHTEGYANRTYVCKKAGL